MSARAGAWAALAAALIVLAVALTMGWWRPPPAAPPAKILWKLSALAPAPSWNDIAALPGIQRAQFSESLDKVYATEHSWAGTIKLLDTHAEITIASAAPGENPIKLPLRNLAGYPLPGFWRSAQTLPPFADGQSPLEGVRIAIDPGHIGGAWARMEERWYRVAGQPTEVMEGELTLATASVLQTMLEEAGAAVTLVREKLEPVTAERPEDFAAVAATEEQRELYFYRKAEIRARADRVNNVIRPDLVVCLHFNAEPWGDPENVRLISTNHLHFIVNGHYSAEELSYDDVRCEMLRRLLQGTHEEEIRLADAVSKSMAHATGLPPYDYGDGHMAESAHRVVPGNPYVWARNLMANRLYLCPVVYCEPYVMNAREVYERVAAGDYPGEKFVAGRSRQSLFREYARGVAEGLKSYYGNSRRRALRQ